MRILSGAIIRRCAYCGSIGQPSGGLGLCAMLMRHDTSGSRKMAASRPTFLLVEMIAAGTRVKTGPKPDDFMAVEGLSAGDFIFDPKLGRYTSIEGMSCGTFDRATLKDRQMDIALLDTAAVRPIAIVVQRDRAAGFRDKQGQHMPDETEPVVYFRLDFARYTILDLGPVWISFQPTRSVGTAHNT
jgi:hypothetical protein